MQIVVSIMARASERSFFSMAAVRAMPATEIGIAEEALLGLGLLYWIGGVLGLGIGLPA